MAADWIPMRIDLRDDPAVIEIAAATKLDLDAVTGKLLRLWGWANRQLRSGNAPVTLEIWIDHFVGATGFANAMTSAGWLKLKNGKLAFPKFDRWNSQSAKKRELNAERQRRFRNAHSNAPRNATRNAKVTTLGEESTGEKEKKIAPPSGEAKPVAFPAELDTPEFREAWVRWLADRKARKIKKLTPDGERTQLRKLAEIGPSTAIDCIEASIANGWQGLFPDKFKTGAARPGFQTHDDRLLDGMGVQ